MAWWQWSKTAASNASADTTINWAEGMPPGSVNDSARAMMARTAEFRDDTNGSLTTAGTSTAYTVTSNQVFTSLSVMDKQKITVVFNVTSGTAPTLAVDGLAAEPLRLQTGTVPPTGAFIAGTPYTFTYFNSTTEFIQDGAAVNLTGITGSQIASNTITATNLAANVKQATIGIIIDGGGSPLTTGQKGFVEVPFNCTITRSTLLADQTGSAVVNIWKVAYASFPPSAGNKITASAPPTISAAQNAQDSTLSGWTTSLSAGDILAFNVDSAATVTRVTLSLLVTKT